ncbi:MAG: YqgE/AlgH family protein [Hahellaceae bacterium]|nr:YqgE/AlgH family protein [Hahellaceae bacterium]
MSSLRNQFLIAMPHLRDQHFEGTITYICEHNESGAMGIVINKPMELRLSEILSQLDIDGSSLSQQVVYTGGPMQSERGFVIHGDGSSWQSSLKVSEAMTVTTSRDILQAMASGEGPPKALIALGYAGWSEGQLEQELANNYWITCEADARILFETPDPEKIIAALGRVGIDYYRLASVAGHG